MTERIITDSNGRKHITNEPQLHPPQRKPLTRERVKEMMAEAGYDNATAQERADFINGLRHCEIAHGIK